jgi:NAD(P)-dependent dehydrogenase (short-subunit alcohol dehydrogenase family)
VNAYSFADIHNSFEAIHKHWPNAELRVALYNIGAGVFKSFLDVTEGDIENSIDTNVRAAYSFAREAILRIKEQPVNDKGKRGTLLFTGATASIRGNTWTSGFAPGKHALRALSQSLAKEFGKQNIHVRVLVILCVCMS